MGKYQLKEPEKNEQSVGYWLFCTLIVSFLVYIVVINPVLSGSWKSWGFFDSAVQYVLVNLGAFVTAGLFMIPVVINDKKHQYALDLMYENRNYVLHNEWVKIVDKLTYHVWRRGNAKQVIEEFEATVDKHKGKDLRVKQYHMKKEFAEDLRVKSE